MVSPRHRHDDVLTHRTAANSRRMGGGIGEADYQSSDSCFDVEEDGCDCKNNTTNGSYNRNRYFFFKKTGSLNDNPPGPSSPIVGPPQSPHRFFSTPGRSNSSQQQQQKRRRPKRRRTQTMRSPILLFFLLVAILVLFVCWKWPSSTTTTTTTTTSQGPSIGRKMTERTNQQGGFEKSSQFGTDSCTTQLTTDDVSFTLVTQVSSDRLWMMEHQCQRWQAPQPQQQQQQQNNTIYYQQYPISIAVFTNDTIQQVQQKLKDMGCDMEQTTVTILSAQLYPSDDYPVNRLRNLALKAAAGGTGKTKITKPSSHAVLVDIDFWITQDLTEILQLPEVTDLLVSDPKATLVIPAFQLHRQCHAWRECPELNVPEMPLDLQDLKQQILAHKVTRFDPTNRGGHGSTKYKEWFKQNNYETGDTLLEIDCFLSNRYEPYLVFKLCHELPPFQTAFAGYGKNKMTWVMQLRRMGYTFWQLGKGAFVIHYPHLDSPSRMAWNNAPPSKQQHLDNNQWQDYKRGRMDQLFVEFRQWLQQEVPDQTRTPFCHDKLDDDARLWYDRKTFNRTAAAAAQKMMKKKA